MKLRIVTAVCLGTLTYCMASSAWANTMYTYFTDAASVKESLYGLNTNPGYFKVPSGQVKPGMHSNSGSSADRAARSEHTILLLMGLSMTGLALWGRRRSPAA